MLPQTKQELCYLTPEALRFMGRLHKAGIRDFDLALELAIKLLGEEQVYSLEQ